MKKYNELKILQVNQPDNLPSIETHPNFFQLPACTVHCGSSKSGKGNTAMNMLFNPTFDLYNKLDKVYLFSSSADSQDPTWSKFIELTPHTVFSKYSDKTLQGIIDEQMKIPKVDRPKIGLIFDDIGGFDLKLKSLLYQVSSFYRHAGIFWVHYMVQKYKLCTPVVRNNTDYMLISNITNKKELEDLNTEIGGLYDDQFIPCLKKATSENYNFLYCKINIPRPELWHNFTDHLYTSSGKGALSIKQERDTTDDKRFEKDYQ